MPWCAYCQEQERKISVQEMEPSSPAILEKPAVTPSKSWRPLRVRRCGVCTRAGLPHDALRSFPLRPYHSAAFCSWRSPSHSLGLWAGARRAAVPHLPRIKETLLPSLEYLPPRLPPEPEDSAVGHQRPSKDERHRGASFSECSVQIHLTPECVIALSCLAVQ
jgi:hypothetical protein